MALLTKQKLLSALEAAAPARGLGLVDLELSGFGRTKSAALVRVYLEKAETGGSPDIDELAAANVWIEELIDQIDPEQGSYTLEVSSPGLDRRLRTLQHFQRYIGAKVRLKTVPIDGRANWTGRLLAVNAADEGAADGADEGAATITLGLDGPGQPAPGNPGPGAAAVTDATAAGAGTTTPDPGAAAVTVATSAAASDASSVGIAAGAANQVLIPLKQIKKANIQAEISFTKGKGQ